MQHISPSKTLEGVIEARAKATSIQVTPELVCIIAAIGDQPSQMGLFTGAEDRFREQLRSIDVSTITPVEALNILFKLTEDAKK